tara:strand:- start:616 stop:1044 length:429 start_codon:yes stop_codon:yes gene_type:complete
MQEYIDFFQAHPILVCVWVMLFIALIVASVRVMLSKFTVISQQEAVQLINKQNAMVFDVRSQDAFKKGHVVNAIQVSLSDIKNQQTTQLSKYKVRPVITVCDLGQQSEQAADLLTKQGFEQVFNLKGGMNEWNAQNLPVTTK